MAPVTKRGSKASHANNMLRLLCITAHPDDEAGAFGGTLLLYHERGVETSVICLTAGTAARNRGTARTDEELAALRRAEFAASCKLLNVSHYQVLDFPDSKLDRTDFYQVVGTLTKRMRQIRPHVVITFGMDGGLTGHAITPWQGVFASMAFEWAGRADRFPEQIEQGLQPHRAQKLYYQYRGLRAARSPAHRSANGDCTHRDWQGALREESRGVQAAHDTSASIRAREKKSWPAAGHARDVSSGRNPRPARAKLEADLFEGVIED